MIRMSTENLHYAGVEEEPGKPPRTDPLFMALVLAQQKTIERLRAQLWEIERLAVLDEGP